MTDERRQQESGRKDAGKMHFNGHKNPHGWLPPCCPIGHWWQGQLYMDTPPDRQINRKAPVTPSPKDRAELIGRGTRPE
ncbi:MAG: hypothetical protein MUO40_10495 [Anaerolineaceae bacterium]|nr:hypothetical protein [Anaerolineaceae bacterium]